MADRDIYVADASSPATPRALDEPHPAAATAAVALAQLHHHRLASDWDTDMVRPFSPIFCIPPCDVSRSSWGLRFYRIRTRIPISLTIACDRRSNYHRCATTSNKNRYRRSLRVLGDFFRLFSIILRIPRPVAHPPYPLFSARTSFPDHANRRSLNRPESRSMIDRDQRSLVGDQVLATGRPCQQSRRPRLGRKASAGRI